MTTAERDALRAVRLLCHSGLDTETLYARLAERLAAHLRLDAWDLLLLDPATGLARGGVHQAERSPAMFQMFLDEAFLRSPAADPAVYASGEARVFRAADVLAEPDRDPYLEHLRAFGFGPDLQVPLLADGRPLGHMVLTRCAGAPPFDDREMRWVGALLPHLVAALRGAAAREALAAQPGGEVGVAVVGADGRLEALNGTAELLLPRLLAGGRSLSEGSPLRYLAGLLARALRGDEEAAVPAVVAVDAMAGRAYRLTAERMKSTDGAPRGMVLIQPVRPAERMDAFLRLGLTGREVEIARAVVRGEGTKRIAAELGISPHTVRHHVRHVLGKVGVGSRRELVACLVGSRPAP